MPHAPPTSPRRRAVRARDTKRAERVGGDAIPAGGSVMHGRVRGTHAAGQSP